MSLVILIQWSTVGGSTCNHLRVQRVFSGDISHSLLFILVGPPNKGVHMRKGSVTGECVAWFSKYQSKKYVSLEIHAFCTGVFLLSFKPFPFRSACLV